MIILHSSDASLTASILETEERSSRGFQTFDQQLKFSKNQYSDVDNFIEKVRIMKQEGYLLYDSDQYLDDIQDV